MSCCPLHIGALDQLNNIYGVAALWIGLAFVASAISPRIGISVALVEILAGVLGGNLLGMATNQWMGVFPATRLFKLRGRQAWYTTMMMSTGLTFGSISALFGYTHGYIDRSQYSVLVTVVVLTALVPTFIAQTVFRPKDTELLHGQPAARASGGDSAQQEPAQAVGAVAQEGRVP